MLINLFKQGLRISLPTLFLIGCGGGGGGFSSTSNDDQTDNVKFNDPTTITSLWTKGVFEPAVNYKDQCHNPRTGIDPYTNSNFPDKAGSSMHEKMWLRSWSNDTYLWYNEIIDVNPQSYSVLSYFDHLKTKERNQSGELKDNFHFAQPTDEYNAASQGGTVSGYGIDWNFVSTMPPRKLIVNYTEDNSPAALANVKRGFELVEIDGIDFINTNTSSNIDKINNALFPSDNGLSHEFTFADPNNNTEITVTLTSADIAVNYVQNVKQVDSGQGSIGYLQLNGFNRNGQSQLISAINQFSNANVSDLVIDLRYNGGGLLVMSSQLAYMVAGQAQSSGLTFETTQFNDKYPSKDPVTNETLTPTPFYDKEIDWSIGAFTTTSLPSLNLARVFILSTENTCSASEALINGLRGIDVEVILIGDSTCGKPYGFYPQDNCGTTYFTIQFSGVNDKGFGEYSQGFKPTPNPVAPADVLGCQVADDYNYPLGDENEALFAAAINYAQTGSCPVQAQTQSSIRQTTVNEDGIAIKTPNTMLNAIIEENKIYTKITGQTPTSH